MASQTELAAREAQRQGWELIRSYEDLGRSAYRDVERPAFDEMVRAIVVDHAYDVLIVRATDRFSRKGALRMAEVVNKIIDAGCRIFPVWEPECDTSTDAGRSLLVAKMEAAWLESSKISQRVREQFARDAAEGKPKAYNRRVFGWTDNRRSEIHPIEGPAIREQVRLVLEEGISFGQVARNFNDQGITTITGTPWTSAKATRTLKNGIYAGLGTYGAYRGDHKPYKGTWPAIITEDEHHALNQLTPKVRRTVKHHKYANILHCHCGRRMHPSMSHRNGRDIYRCQPGEHVANTINKLELEEHLDAVVEANYWKAAIWAQYQRNTASSRVASERQRTVDELAAIQKRLEDLATARFVEGLIDEDNYRNAYVALTAKRQQVEQSIRRIEQQQRDDMPLFDKDIADPATKHLLVLEKVTLLPRSVKFARDPIEERLDINFRFPAGDPTDWVI